MRVVRIAWTPGTLVAPYILALDQGTTSSRAVLFDGTGSVTQSAYREIQQITPADRPGIVEHDPFEILTSLLGAAVEMLERAGVQPRDIAGLGIANQRETTIVWDRTTGTPLGNAIVWQDRRTAEICRQMAAAGEEKEVRLRTGLRLDPYFSATKIAWMLDNIFGARARAERGALAFGTVDSWLIWKFTGGKRHVTDRTNASRTLLYNLVEDRWDPDLLRLFRIPAAMLPEVVWSSERLGPVTAIAGLAGIEIAGVAGDQQAALFGQRCVAPGDAKNTYGTGCFLLRHLGGEFLLSRHGMLTTLACAPDRTPQFALEGSVFAGGAVTQWLRDGLGFFANSREIEAMAASVPDSAGVVLVPGFTGLGAPHWDPHATGLLIGLARGTTRGHIARAALEAIAFQVSDLVEAMNSDVLGARDNNVSKPLDTLRVDGGASANDLLMQFQADLLGVPLRRPAVLETTAVGAASLASLAVGCWPQLEHLGQFEAEPQVFHPGRERDWAEARLSQWHRAVERAKSWNTEP